MAGKPGATITVKDWINLRQLKGALRFYSCGLLITAPVAIYVSRISGTEAAFRVTVPLAITSSCLLLAVEFFNGYSFGESFFRRLIDIIFSVGMLILLAPALILTLIAIEIDNPGPLFSRRLVVGMNGRVFTQIKFRTVRNETLLREEKHLRFVWKVTNDPRLTRVGALLRLTSIDELPQLFNVLKGDMTLVGPRPEVAALVARNVVPVPHTQPGLTPVPLLHLLFQVVTGRAMDIFGVRLEFDRYKEILRNKPVAEMPATLIQHG